MSRATGKFEFFQRHKDYAGVFIRIIVGSFVIWGVQDNVFSHERMEEFAKFLAGRGVPFPLFAAHLSAYVQFICGVLIILGAWIRPASLPFIVNFVAALIIAHRGDGFREMFPALMMLFAGFFFLFNGAGKLSVDDVLEKRDKR